jgi:UTP:GlnB (protein PII) uridylyltransferase
VIREQYLAERDAARLLHQRCRLIDEVLGELWRELAMPPSLALVAVGGYGRGELYPASDVDLLILLPEQADSLLAARLEQLVCLFWDIGLEIGHSVRTIEQCLEEAAGDITVQTAMIESRLLTGSARLFAGFSSIVKGSLDARVFFQTKRVEQEDRHQRFSDTPYSLEANCKDGPGGLRDLQLILWIAQAAGYGKCWKDLEQRGFITDEEGRVLEACEGFPASAAYTAPPASRAPGRSPALRVPDGTRRATRFRCHGDAPVQRATDAAILPDSQDRHPDQRHPAAEHWRGAFSASRMSRRSQSMSASRMCTSFST